jgi:O-antigen ligase
MGISTEKPVRQELIFICLLLLLTGLFTSRLLLSSAIILLLLLTCVHKEFPQQLQRFIRSPMLAGMAILLMLPLLSWFWSEDKTLWARFVRIKLPLFLLPLAFAGNWRLSPKQWKMVAGFFLFLLFSGCCWSLWQYVQDIQGMNRGYLRAKVMATPLENDHVRFSLLVCIGVICSSLLMVKSTTKKTMIPAGLLAFFFITYLHILSARTGLFGLYIFLAGAGIYYLFLHRQSRWSLAALLVLFLMPALAWFTLPTFQNRIRYFLYDFSFIQKDQYLPGANDGNRIISLKAGWQLIKEHPLGVGMGDVIPQTNAWYRFHMPAITQKEQLFPSSEWLMYGGIAGWPGMILFTVIISLPFFQRKLKDSFYWFSLNAVMAFSLLFDIGLEVQFGVFIYSFFILWWWKWLQPDVSPEKHRTHDVNGLQEISGS